MDKEKDWFKKAKSHGALCFSLKGYGTEIKKITESIHFKIDLSESFQGYRFDALAQPTS